MTFKQKLNMSYTLIIIILISIISYCHYLIHISDTKRNMSRTMDELSNQLAVNLDNYLDSLISSTMRPLYDRDQIEKLMAEKRLEELNPTEIRDLENYLRSIYLFPNTEDITAAHFFDNWGGSISLYQKDQRYSTSTEFMEAFIEGKEAAGRYVVSDSFLSVSSNGVNTIPLFSIVRQLNIYELNQPYGTLILDVNLTKVDSLLSNIQIGSGSYVSLVNENNQVIYSTNKEEITSSSPNHEPDQWLQAETKLEMVPWKLKVEIPLKSVSNQKEMLMTSLWIMIASIMAAILLSGWFSRKITLPLEQLQRLMRRAESGEFNLRFQTKSRDEIYDLGNSFNQMLVQIKDLINSTYIAEIRQREAQFSALQSQISPHFLFNTLETIRMTAEAEGNTETARMITSLGKLLKVNFQQQSWVTLRQELDYVQHYLYLQSVRLSYSPNIIMECDESLSSITVHSFIIQPIVENSVLHGLRPLPRSGTIHVKVTRNDIDSTFEIHVSDDGVGMPAEQIQNLRQKLQYAIVPSSDQETSIGLINIQRRIQLSYGKEYGLTIDSAEGNGTSVSCRLPLGDPLLATIKEV